MKTSMRFLLELRLNRSVKDQTYRNNLAVKVLYLRPDYRRQRTVCTGRTNLSLTFLVKYYQA